jgi:hypothetical protein
VGDARGLDEAAGPRVQWMVERSVTRTLGIRLVLLVLVAVLAVGPVVLTTQAGDVSLGGAHWARSTSRFTLRVGDSVTRRWSRVLDQSVRAWNQSDVVTLRVVRSGTDSRQNCKARNGRVEVCSARYGQNGWLGLSRIWVDGSNHIVRASVMINDTYFDQNYYDDPKARRHTVCHELGHVLGLDHGSNRSCMNDSNASVFRDVRPSKQDFNRLERLYRHRDSRASVRAARSEQAGSFGAASAPPLPDDETFSTSSSVRSESLGGGARLVTYITWVKKGR